MKKIQNLILASFVLFAFSSCDDYLTVNPKTQMTEEMLFSTEVGFQDALTGVYIQLKSPESYGKSLTMGVVENLVTNWDVTSPSTESKIGLFDFANDGVANTFTRVYAKQYATIASINAILGKIDVNKSVLRPEMYKLIKGECLALRAYCHFDILRLWGPVPTVVNADVSVLPYVTTLSAKPHPFSKYDDYKKAILTDLTEAEVLLKDVDPIRNYSLQSLGSPNNLQQNDFNTADTYNAYRYLRMNYYAAKALEARANLWFGDSPAAYSAAKELIAATNPDSSKKFKLGTAADMSAADYTLRNEQIFSIYDFGLYQKYKDLFGTGTFQKGSNDAIVKAQLYGNTGTDIRETYLWLTVTQPAGLSTCICRKYEVPSTAAAGFSDANRIPMLRLSEMYFIAIETTTQFTEAQTLWNEFRAARNLAPSVLQDNKTAIKDELLKEYRIEFFAEGQAFCAYKRLNAPRTQILWIPSGAIVNYILPLPKTELNTSN